MAKLHQIYQRLQALGDPCIDQAMAQALPSADPAMLRLITLILLQRQDIQGLVAVVENFHRLPEQVQQTVLQHSPELTRALRVAMDHPKLHGPANAIHIIHKSASTRQAYLVADQLRHGQDKLKNEAAHCLLEMAERTTSWSCPKNESVLDPIEAVFVSQAIQDAVRFYPQHGRQDILQAVISLPINAVMGLLASIPKLGTPTADHTAALLTKADTPAARRALLPALGIPSLFRPAIDGMRIAINTGTIDQALVNGHLLLLKKYRLPLKQIKNPEGYCPNPDAPRTGEAPHSSLGLARWLSALPTDRSTLIRQLGGLTQSSNPCARLSALRELLELAHDAPADAAVHETIARFATDPTQSLARVALGHLTRVRYPKIIRVLAQLANSRHPDIRRIAARRLAPMAFIHLWESWSKLDHAQQIAAGRALIKIDPRFHAALADKLALPEQADKLRALSIVNQLNQGLLLQNVLIPLTQDPDPYVVSSAIKALGSAEPDRATSVIESALEHEDQRVRANAIEALTHLNSSRHVDKLAGMAEQEDNRARANAIQALMQMRTADALSALSRMLSDPRTQHRASALWLVETMGIAEVAREVAEMSISETDPQVKARAGRVIHEIIEQMSQPLPLDIFKYEDPDPHEPARPDHAAAG